MKLFEKIKKDQTRIVKILGFSFAYNKNKFKPTKISFSAKLKNVKLYGSNVIRKKANFVGKSKNSIIIGKGTEFGPNCGILAKENDTKITIGENCNFGQNVHIGGIGNVEIGNNALFASNILILSTNHNYEDALTAVKFQGSRGGNIKIGSEIKILKDVDVPLTGRDVIIVEDIIDTGCTLEKICEVLKTRNVASLKICTLLNKPSRRKVDIKIDYNGFDIEDEFVVGYGIDYAQKYRNLPYIGVVE